VSQGSFKEPLAYFYYYYYYYYIGSRCEKYLDKSCVCAQGDVLISRHFLPPLEPFLLSTSGHPDLSVKKGEYSTPRPYVTPKWCALKSGHISKVIFPQEKRLGNGIIQAREH
jgi:hypothetical protein